MRKIKINKQEYKYTIGKQYIKIYNINRGTSAVVSLSDLRPEVGDFWRERDENKGQDGMICPRHISTWVVDKDF